MTTAIAPVLDPAIVQQVLLSGDLKRLTPAQRVEYYARVCESVGLNPLTRPFAYLVLDGQEQLYARKDATDQLRFIHKISIDPKAFTREVIEGIYIVTAGASMPNGRTDVSTGAVPIEGVKGLARANAVMKAETKAKRRVTLSICGLGMLDETEIETIPNAQVIEVPSEVLPEPTGYPPMPNPTPPPPKLPPAPEGAVYLARLDMKRSKNGTEWADVVDDRGEVYIVFDPQLVPLVESLIQERVPVVVATKKTSKGYTQITKITRWTPPTAVKPTGPPSVDEIPF